MEITWFGQACFELKNQMATLMTDPDLSQDRSVKFDGDIISFSHVGLLNGQSYTPSTAPKFLSKPGEYEIKDVFIRGYALYPPESTDIVSRTLAFIYQMDEIKICHLGNLSHVPTRQQLESLDHIDVLLIPVGGGSSLNAAKASEVIRIIEPRIVIPMSYATSDINADLDTVEKFLKEMGVNQLDPQTKVRIRANNFPEETQVIILSSNY